MAIHPTEDGGRAIRRSAGRFILGVESLTGLVAGAAALVAFVSALVLWMVISDARSALETAAYARAEYLAAALGSRPSQSILESLVSSSVPGGAVEAVAVTSADGLLIAYPPVSEEDIRRGYGVTFTSAAGFSVTLLMKMPAGLELGKRIVLLVGLFAVLLTVVAVTMPSYLRRTVLEPLRNILGQADRIEKGGGRSPRAADASFGKLVDLLSKQDAQLKEMNAQARKRAEVAESRSGAVLEAMGSAVVVLDEDNRPSLWNYYADELFRVSSFDEHPESLVTHLEPVLQQNLHQWDGEIGGKLFTFNVTEAPTGERVVLVTDVSASIALERKLSEESALADLGALSGGVAHEIGNALCALEGFIKLLGRGSESERTLNILQEASLELESARKIVDSFRNLSQQSGFDQSLSVEDAVKTIRGICETFSVTCQVSPELNTSGRIQGESVALARILSNLLSNALRYCSCSDVSVSLHNGHSPYSLIFTVVDNGPGLPDDTDIVFRAMFTTEEHNGGMGLGLTITRRLVNALGGTVKAENTADGASFTVTVPYLEEVE